MSSTSSSITMKSFKSKLDKIAQATEGKFNEVKTAIQQKLNENENKKQEVSTAENQADLLQGWTMLADKGGVRGQDVEFDAEELEQDVAQTPREEGDARREDDARDTDLTEGPATSTHDSLDEIPLISDYVNKNSNNNVEVGKKKDLKTSRVETNTTVTTKAPENTGYFSMLTNAIIWNVLSQVDAFDLCQLSRTSSHFFKLATNEFLWERLYIKVFRKNTKVDKALWYEQLQHGGYRSLFGTKLCEEQLNKTLRSLQNLNPDHNAVEWLCKPLVSVQNFFTSTETKVVMFGLDGSGKTSILYKLARGEPVKTEHTIGFNHEQIEHKGYKLDIWDLEHKPKNQYEFWKTYFSKAQGIIFVVDGTAPEHVPQARVCLEAFMASPQLADLPLLIYVNKRDVVESLSTLQVLVGLNLHYLCNKSGWHIQPCSTKDNDYSLEEGLDWFCDVFKNEEVQRLKQKIVS